MTDAPTAPAAVEVARDPYVAEAKRLILDKLENHPNEGVRMLAAFGLPDDAPQVLAVASVLRGDAK